MVKLLGKGNKAEKPKKAEMNEAQLRLHKAAQKRKMKAVAGGAVAVVVVAAGVMGYQATTSTGTSTVQNTYKEEVVTRGDIVVGVTEVGTAQLEDIEVSFEFAVELKELFVTAGEYVKEGDIVAYCTLPEDEDYDDSKYDSADEEYDSLVLALKTAQTEYDSAVLQAEIDRLEAALTLQNNSVSGTKAEYQMGYDLASLQLTYESLEKEIADLEKELADAEEDLAEGYDADEAIEEYEYQIGKLESKIAQCEVEYKHALTCTYTYESGGTWCSFPSYSHDLSGLLNSIEGYEDDIDDYERLIELAEEDSVEAEEDWIDEMEDLIDDLETEISWKQKELLAESYSISLAEAEIESTYQEGVYVSDTAQLVYETTLLQIDIELELAALEVEQAQENLDEFEFDVLEELVQAPCDGYVMTVADIGDINAYNDIMTIGKDDAVELVVSIDQEDINDVELGMDTLVVLDAYEEYALPATVSKISVSPSSGISTTVSYTVTIYCELTDYDEIVVYEGMTGNVTFIQEAVNDSLLISSKCVTTENGKQTVLRLLPTGDMEVVEVTTGFSDGFDVEILSGLEEGDIVLLESAVVQNATN
ncbi:HlyD family efflux transporter periplasmic adaptor subunit [Chakrabartyella piscis]|uniref:HlyD family efflux transporter periplasmic adaptor subunit n=1 Tax=Chakrabartyella piscis TaxID=2918914 RepID=UPI00295894D5|nr:HlyD family efflux transporter periplasmic adaptor subunit [Chakrabartyella piscis]